MGIRSVLSGNHQLILTFRTPVQNEITRIGHVDEKTDPNNAMFDLILELTSWKLLGTDISFKDKIIVWDDVSLPMKEQGLVLKLKQGT